jgi:uncharacterized phage protein (TIGR01671 family)
MIMSGAINDRHKYRAWHKKEKRMITNEQDFIPLIVTSRGVLRLNPKFEEKLYSLIPLDDFILMQCTGIPDRNKKLIYESDILRFESPTRGSIVVVMSWELYHFMVNDIPIGGLGWTFIAEEGVFCEIIGDIHNNPELIERKDAE